LEPHMPELPLIDRLKIAAQFLVPIVKEMEGELGRGKAQAIVRAGIAKEFRAMARAAVETSHGSPVSALLSLNAGVRQGIDIQTDVRPSADGFEMDVTDCVYAQFFKELGEPELGFLLVCSADFDMADAIPGVELQRTTTIMEGASHCDFRYRFLD
jgi:L-2-amino-thiazoline-4-carboxylic acid hydrolase